MKTCVYIVYIQMMSCFFNVLYARSLFEIRRRTLFVLGAVIARDGPRR